MSGCIKFLEVENFRSIHDKIKIIFPENSPLVLLGENNAGKSNILRGLDLVLGESWPGSHEPDDHEFWSRNPQNCPISIQVSLTGVRNKNGEGINGIRWSFDQDSNSPDFKTFSGNFVNKEILDQCTVVTIGADRRLSYQLSYANKWTLLAKLMKRFHKYLTCDEERIMRLKKSFEEIKSIFEEVSEFSVFQAGLQEQFTSMIESMTYRLALDFSAYDPSNYFQSLRVYPVEGQEIRNIEELGTGEEQILALAFAHAYARAFHGGIVLAIEEPEAHLHPLAQLWLARKIREFTNDGLQIIITTHSPAFISLLNLDGIVLVKKINNSTTIKQLNPKSLVKFCLENGGDPNKISEMNILSFYDTHATHEILSGLFAKRVILVEGQTEEFALKVYLKKVKLDVEKLGLAIIPVLGKGNLAKWWRFFNAYEIPTYVIFDNDCGSDKEGIHRKDLLATLKIDNPQEIIDEQDWVIEDKFSLFGADFEKTMRNELIDYSKFEELAKERFGSSKPLIARFVAESIYLPANSPQLVKFSKLKDKILNVGTTRYDQESSDFPLEEFFDPNEIPF